MTSAKTVMTWLFGMGVSAAAISPVQAGMIDKADMAPWEICGLCHGLDGNSAMPKFPKLSAQKATYIERQFWAFRHQTRTNDGGQMQAITEEVAAAEVADIAAYFARQPAPQPLAPETPEADLYALGKQLYHMGRKTIPACASCHNAEHPTAPWLDSQHPGYLRKQLQDFADGQRNHDPNTADSKRMQNIAERLTAREKDALANYLSQTQLRKTVH